MQRYIRLAFAPLVLILGIASTGCSTMNNTEKGAAVGGGMGALVGTAIGAATGNPRTGAVVGGLGGATLGALAGNKEDEREKGELRQAVATAQAQQHAPLGLTDVVSLSRQGVDPGVIINQIRATNARYSLSTSDIQYMTEQQVSPQVIRAMQETQMRSAAPGRVIYREAPVVIERPVPVYPVVGPPAVGFSYSHVRVR
jgi:Zn-dependent alcohol dehydrogenase